MASIITHGISALMIGKASVKKPMGFRFWFYLTILSMLPDLDVVGMPFGIKYGDFWGHRGFTHSFVFAFLIALFITTVFYRNSRWFSLKWWGWVSLYFVVVASHGLFDAMTDGGLGIAFFSPFDNGRYFLPWTPVSVSPIGINEFVSQRGVNILISEITWILAPLGILLGGFYLFRRFFVFNNEDSFKKE